MFELLHPTIQRWIRDQGWDELRNIQGQAIRAILQSDADVLIAASTAAGKTEAAFLPILTRIAARTRPGLSVLYVSPLKALINDQFRRLEDLCEKLDLPVVRWHGDAPQSAKARLLENPAGVILITPESIEALLLRKSQRARDLFAAVDFIVIDELHAFLRGPRGLQLASQLTRLDQIGAPRARRIGLSATIGDLGEAANWLQPAASQSVQLLQAEDARPALQLKVFGWVEPPTAAASSDAQDESPPEALDRIAEHAFGVLRGDNNLVFAGARGTVEMLADRLRALSENESVPNEFFAHHGNLSKHLREELELRLKEAKLPTTAIATTTLELGIDIGSVRSVAQIDAPRSIASLRQRIGRSGRRKGTPAILRVYLREPHIDASSSLLERLRIPTALTVASIRLLAARFIEPAGLDPSIFSTLLHQILALIVERGAAKPKALFQSLCGPGPFSEVTQGDFATLLRAMGTAQNQLIEQAPDGAIMLGALGEKLTSGYDFFAVFETNDEWRLVHSARTLGTIPLDNIVVVGGVVTFAGRRWRITSVDETAKVIAVEAHRTGQVPSFEGGAWEPIHDRLIEELKSVYENDDIPSYLDHTASLCLFEGRELFRSLKLDRPRIAVDDHNVVLLTWRGTEINAVISAVLSAAAFNCRMFDAGVVVDRTTPPEIHAALTRTLKDFDLANLAQRIGGLASAKFDRFVPDALLRSAWLTRITHKRDAIAATIQDLVR